MNKRLLFVMLAAGLGLSLPALGQTEEGQIYLLDYRYFIYRWDTAYLFSEPFNPNVDTAVERDIIEIQMDVEDADIGSDEGEDFFYSLDALWVPYSVYYSPEPPPMEGETVAGGFESVDATEITSATTATVYVYIRIPEWTGQNQAKLRGFIDYDVRWNLLVRVYDDPEPGENPAPGFIDDIYAAENSALRPPNPPPFADAGADITVEAGSVVQLDGSRTFDSFNLGFNTQNSNVFEKDNIEYVWEQLDGPQVVEPEYPDLATNPWLAEVQLDVIGSYVYRLAVTDGQDAVPDLDTITIDVVSDIPVNRAPRAVISICTDDGVMAPAESATVTTGQVVTIFGSQSFDANSDQYNDARPCDAAEGDWDIVANTGRRMGIMEVEGGGCLAGWVTNPDNGHCYAATAFGTWAEAEDQAITAGGHLVTINDEAEQAFLVENFPAITSYWIGLFRLNGEWVWSSGQTPEYTNFGGSNPDNYTGSESRVVLYLDTTCDLCSFYWRQTDEVGGPFPVSEFGDDLQPLSGVQQNAITWQTQRAGTYYFTLVIDDGELSDAASFTLEVIDAAETNDSTTSTNDDTSSTDDTTDTTDTTDTSSNTEMSACGAGILPLGLLPLLMWPMRRRLY